MMFLKLPREQKEQMISEIQQYFYKERGEEIGHLAAENMLDFFMKHAGPILYNQAISDARRLVADRMASIEDDLYALEKR
ncbi:DUF2164 domain-containing protein [Fictibacillus sp. Mic-4]|uniref:DUF2164 domain-containing protein n=1 Tax=Fictibacillus TaxID=1329200 RepID=UPI00041C3F59|nr:DUF2164 domain-containing protein [Fictibacillus gelatini]